jgi:6-hydroxynicotinate 3-monooxygenase
MHVLRFLGVEDELRSEAFYPRSWNNKDWRTDQATLASAVPDTCIQLNHELVGLDHSAAGVRLSLATAPM